MKRRGRITALLLAACMLVTAGCGRDGQTEEAQSTQTEEGGERAYGRYIGTALGLTGEVERNGGFTVMEDGSYRLAGYNSGIWASADQGKTWTAEPAEPWFQLLQATYCPSAVFAPDGTMAAISNGTVSGIVVQAALEGRMLTEEEQTQAREEPLPEGPPQNQEIWEQNHFGILVTPEGGIRFLDFGLENSPESYTAMSRLWFSPDNRLYGGAVDGAVYEIDQQDGSLTQLFTMEAEPGYLAFSDSSLLTVGREGLYRFDLAERVLKDVNPAINSFITKKIGNGPVSFPGGAYPVAIASDADGQAVYLSCRDGLYRATLDGSSIEQVIDGALSAFGDGYVVSMQVLEGDRFLVQFEDNSLILYEYDSKVPAMPEKELTVYSFQEQPFLREAVTAYKNKHQDTYVRYETGYNGEDGVTEEDAVKNLNTQLASGKGADVLILDGLWSRTYVEKGILADLTELIGSLPAEEAPLSNIVEGMKTEAGLYLIPMYFSVPVVLGEQDEAAQLQTLKGLADYMEAHAAEGNGGLIGIHDAEILAELLAVGAEQAWMNEDNGLAEDAVRDFLTQTKRIYDAENKAVSQAERDEIDAIDAEARQYMGEGAVKTHLNVGANAMYQAGGYSKLSLGRMDGVWFDALQIVSLQNMQEELEFLPYDGQGQNLFLPGLVTGINAASDNREAADAFLETMLSSSTQEKIDGFPVNRAAFDKAWNEFNTGAGELGEDLNTGSHMGYPIAGQGGYQSGNIGSLQLFWPDGEQKARLKEILTGADTPALTLPLLRKIVCETAVMVMEEELGAEDGLERIRKQAALYLAE